ncbi:MAG: type II toxin-antitoxin system RelE/ParE family toxin [Deltaproteobacteria bacterium]|nr:type II toxin-antitoxin system RelE/ParE family toxin [Deltaproteobacteria bacterium]
MKIVWLPVARQDLQQIENYYCKEAGKQVSAKILRKIVHSATFLLEHPYIGHATSSDEVREMQVGSLPFLLPYRVKDKRIEILRVFHESQERPESWEEM